MTIANRITIFRTLLIPLFGIELSFYAHFGNESSLKFAVILFLVIAALDVVDGFLARLLNEESEFGSILDPFADKLLLATSILILTFYRGVFLSEVPIWFAGVIIGCDSLLLIGFLITRLFAVKPVVRPRAFGKISAGLQMIIVFFVLLRWNLGLDNSWFIFSLICTATCTVISTLIYTWDGKTQVFTNNL